MAFPDWLFHLGQCFQASSLLYRVSVRHSSSWLNRVAMERFVYPFTDGTWVVSTLGLVGIMLLLRLLGLSFSVDVGFQFSQVHT